MFDNLNPQLSFYLLFYLITIIIRFIRAYRSRPKEVPLALKEYWVNYLYFGFELVLGSAGVFILVLEAATRYAGAIMIMYGSLIIMSAFLEEEGVGRKLKTIGHVVVSCLVVLVTLAAFTQVHGLKSPISKDSQTGVPVTQKWRVSLPYVDISLNRNFGIKSKLVQNVYIVEVSGKSRLEAIQIARSQFYSDQGPMPFNSKTPKTDMTMIIREDNVVVELCPQ